MADNWMNDRDREMRDRDWRRSEQYGRGDYRGRDDGGRESESRSFDDSRFGAQRSGAGRDRVFGERETGANYTRSGGVTSGGGAYGAGGSYGGGESYGRGARGGQAQFERQDYTQGGRYYGDDRREPIYRQEYGQGGVEYGDVPRGYDAERSGGRGYGGGYGQGGYQGGYGGDNDRNRQYGEAGSDRYQANYARAYGAGGSGERYNSGGTGGYDYDRGYGDAGRGPGGRDRGSRFEDNAYRAGQDTGDFFHRAGEKISSWFRGDRYMSDSDGDAHRSYREDYGRENNVRFGDRGHRGRGPKDYKRSDERINEEVHDRLTDDAWLDASNINVAVSDGEVTLNGSVDNRESKHRAERLIEDLSGVKHVQNNLRVDDSSLTGSGRGFGDNMVSEQVRSYETSRNEGDRGASGLSGRTSTGALAERSTGTAKDGSEDPITGKKN